VVDIASPPEYLTITVINSHGDAISTSHAHNADGPSAVSGNVAQEPVSDFSETHEVLELTVS